MTCRSPPQHGQAFVSGSIDDLFARQMRSAGGRDWRGASLWRRHADRTVRLDLRVLDAEARLDILQRQFDLVVGDALGATPELGSPQHRDDVIETVGLRRQTIDLGFECCVPRFEAVARVGQLREAATLGGKLSLAG